MSEPLTDKRPNLTKDELWKIIEDKTAALHGHSGTIEAIQQRVQELEQALSRWYSIHDAIIEVLEGRQTSDDHSLVQGVKALQRQVEALTQQRDARPDPVLYEARGEHVIRLLHELTMVRDERDDLKRSYEDLRDHFTPESLRGQIAALQQQLAATRVRWTTDKPTKPGWYWFLRSRDPLLAQAVEIKRMPIHEDYGEQSGKLFARTRIDEDDVWIGELDGKWSDRSIKEPSEEGA